MKAARLLPSLFLPHGAPDLAISQHPAASFLRSLAANLPRPDGIVTVSAHWESRGLQVTSSEQLETIYDFGGFAPELYQIKYPARAERWLVDAVCDCIRAAGYEITENPTRGLDHGAWVPLHLAFPNADIPVVQLSLDRDQSAAGQIEAGRALAALRQRNVLVIGSGGSVHNLHAIAPEGSPTPDWAVAFDAWLDGVLAGRDFESLAAFRDIAPHARMAHPSVEHFLPLLVAAGAGGRSASVEKMFQGYSYGSIGMSAWAFM